MTIDVDPGESLRDLAISIFLVAIAVNFDLSNFSDTAIIRFSVLFADLSDGIHAGIIGTVAVLRYLYVFHSFSKADRSAR